MAQEIEKDFKNILVNMQGILNFKIDKESIENTPSRVTKMFLNELLCGYRQDPQKILSKTFKSKSNDMVIVKNIPFVSLCSHHWLPFIGHLDIGYIPKKNIIVGLSKIPRLIHCYAKRFQMQENMTSEIADALYKYLKPEGCIVICTAQHLCSQIRGVQSHNTDMLTSAIKGCFKKKDIKEEFLNLIK